MGNVGNIFSIIIFLERDKHFLKLAKFDEKKIEFFLVRHSLNNLPRVRLPTCETSCVYKEYGLVKEIIQVFPFF